MISNERDSKLCVILATSLAIAIPASGSPWTSAASLNVPRQFFGADVDETGNIWVVGGWNRTSGCGSSAGPLLDSIEVLWFNGTTYAPTWDLTSIIMPEPRYFHTVVVADNQLYVMGGLNALGASGCSVVATVDRYDIATGTWDSTAVPPLPVPRYEASAIVDGLGRIWYIGGQTDCLPNLFTNQVDIFDPAQPQLGWQPGPPLNTARARFGAVLEDGRRIYAIGGYSDAGHIQTVERIDTCAAGTWEVLAESLPGPTTNDDQAVLGSDGQIYVVGGWVAHNFTNRVIRRDAISGMWSSVDSLITARSGHRTVLGADNNIYALAGSVSGCNSSIDVESTPLIPVGSGFADCNSNGVNDQCELTLSDCNSNGIPDDCDISSGTSGDCNSNGVPDSCDLRTAQVPAESVPYFAGQDQITLEASFPPTLDWALDPWDVAAMGDHGNFHNDTAPWEGILREEVMAGVAEGFTLLDRTAASTIPPGLPVQGGEQMTIIAQGSWARGPLLPHLGPEGGTVFVSHDEYESLGVSLIEGCPGESLIGVFLSNDPPDPNNIPPRLACGDPDMLKPDINQAFFIGASAIGVVAPPAATRLFLGFQDSSAWWNNDGEVSVTIFSDCNTNAIQDDCESDVDADQVIDECDNCPFESNPTQNDFDNDGVGDACDPDIDDDGVDNGPDVCDFTPASAITANRVILDPASSLYGTVRGDYDDDCDCDLADYSGFMLDFTGATASP